MGHSEFDETLFVRGRKGVVFFRNSNYDSDPVFSTGYDGELAKLMAHEQFVQYVTKRLEGEALPAQEAPAPIPTLFCTATLRDITELEHSFFASGLLGNETIRKVQECFHISRFTSLTHRTESPTRLEATNSLFNDIKVYFIKYLQRI